MPDISEIKYGDCSNIKPMRDTRKVCPVMSRENKVPVDLITFEVKLNEVKCLEGNCMAWEYDKNTDTVGCKMMRR